MPGRIVDIFSRLNPRKPPEGSIQLRLVVLACILIAEVTIVAMGYFGALTTFGVPLLTITGFAVSWHRRHERNLLLKLVLVFAVIAVAAFFLRELVTSFYDTRLPLIKLFLWLQVLHSFDLPARRDLKFSLVSGLILITAGAVLTTGMVYSMGLLLFSITGVLALMLFQVSEEAERADRTFSVAPARLLAGSLLFWVALMALTVPVMLFLPQSSQARLTSLPISELRNILGEFTSEVVNPAYTQDGNPFDAPPQFSPDSYFGFNPYMDLRSRGQLSEEIVLKVRSDYYDFYRGTVFDVYNGKGWVMSDEEGEEIVVDTLPFDLPVDYSQQHTGTDIQSFYVQTDLPNIIFSGGRPVSLYFPADRIRLDKYGSLRSPYQLTDDIIYSVVTERPLIAGSHLRKFPRSSDEETESVYTGLPEEHADEMLRIEKLTREVTNGYDNVYDKALAVEQYLKANYTYDLDIGPQTTGDDAVSYFLFEERRGYCEHFSSAMAVMLRSIGIPTRIVTGYAGGSYNPFTGLWEIRQRDAHAWVEVYFGSAGWAPFDPTPGFDIPTASEADNDRLLINRLIAYLGDIDLGPLGSVFSATGAAVRSTVLTLAAIPPQLTLAAAAVLVVLSLAGRHGISRLTRRRRRLKALMKNLSPEYREEPALRDYLAVLLGLFDRGVQRRPEETLREFSRRAARYIDAPEFEELTGIVEAMRYGGAGMQEAMRERTAGLRGAVLGRIDRC